MLRSVRVLFTSTNEKYCVTDAFHSKTFPDTAFADENHTLP